MTTVGLSAFCHISEYGRKGYEYLPQMVLLGRPLTLWAPSSRLVLAHSGLSAETFLNLIDGGHIRVIGRERWIMSREARDSHPYADARWTSEVDDTLRVWCVEDLAKPAAQQRVATSPPEDGYIWADQHLEQNKRQVESWYDRFQRSPHSIPSGTRETVIRNLAEAAEEGLDQRYVVARTILRDARNHGKAFQDSSSDIAIHLSKVDIDFLRSLNDEADRPTILQRRGATPTPSEAISAEITRQTTELLARLLDARDSDPTDLWQFLQLDARDELLEWVRRLCDQYALYPPAALDGVVFAQLKRELERGRFAGSVVPPWRWREGGADSSAGLLGAVTSLLDATMGGVSVPGYVGFGVMTFSATRILLRALGHAPTRFSGPNWPFLFALDKPPTKKRRQKLLELVRHYPDR